MLDKVGNIDGQEITKKMLKEQKAHRNIIDAEPGGRANGRCGSRERLIVLMYRPLKGRILLINFSPPPCAEWRAASTQILPSIAAYGKGLVVPFTNVLFSLHTYINVNIIGRSVCHTL